MNKLKSLKGFIKKQSAARLITSGFAIVILLGSVLLMLPISIRDGADVKYIDALFTSTSAVCVTGLVVIDVADNFTVFGRIIVAMLIQIGGLGVTCIGAGIILAARKRIGFKEMLLIRESWNVMNYNNLVTLVKKVLFMTLCFEAAGTALSFIVFVRDYSPIDALGISAFHSVAAFNNSGFDILGGMKNLLPYRDDILMNIVTSLLIIFGGIGFLVILDVKHTKSFKRLRLHSKAVIATTLALIIAGTVLLMITEKDITLLGAYFQSVSTRTAGFATFPIDQFSSAGLFVMAILMFIGASPGSTGGGIKTTTFFAMLCALKSSATNQHCTAFKRRLPPETIKQAFVVSSLSLILVCAVTIVLCISDPQNEFICNLFEAVSAFGTVGLSAGVTPGLSLAGKITIIITMFIGRLGAFAIATLWFYKTPSSAFYTEEGIAIG